MDMSESSFGVFLMPMLVFPDDFDSFIDVISPSPESAISSINPEFFATENGQAALLRIDGQGEFK